jgi:hypothetical protein
MANKVAKKAAPKKVAAKKEVSVKAENKSEDQKQNWALAEEKLNEAISRKGKDGHYYNTVVAPLEEKFNAGGLNDHLYEAIMQLN